MTDPETEKIEKALDLLRHLEDDELSLNDCFKRIETVTTSPHLQRQILQAAESEGVIEREEETVQPVDDARVNFEEDIITKEGDFSCERCNTGLSTGYFIKTDAAEHGPFGSTCIRKVTGRE